MRAVWTASASCFGWKARAALMQDVACPATLRFCALVCFSIHPARINRLLDDRTRPSILLWADERIGSLAVGLLDWRLRVGYSPMIQFGVLYTTDKPLCPAGCWQNRRFRRPLSLASSSPSFCLQKLSKGNQTCRDSRGSAALASLQSSQMPPLLWPCMSP